MQIGTQPVTGDALWDDFPGLERLLSSRFYAEAKERLNGIQMINYREDPDGGTRTLDLFRERDGASLHSVTRHQDGRITLNGGPFDSDADAMADPARFHRVLNNNAHALLFRLALESASPDGRRVLSTVHWRSLRQANQAANRLAGEITVPSVLPPGRGGKPAKEPTPGTAAQRFNRILIGWILDRKSMERHWRLFGREPDTGELSVRSFNIAHQDGEILLEMRRTQAALVGLYLRLAGSAEGSWTEGAGHPGQIIARIREKLPMSGYQWRHLCRMAQICPESVFLIDTGSLPLAAQALGEANRPEAPPDRVMRLALDHAQHRFFAETRWKQGDPWRVWINLINQFLDPGNGDIHAAEEFRRITDTLRSHVTQDLPWNPGSWESLSARSRRWHANRRGNNGWTLPAHAVDAVWTSELPDTEIGKYVCRPVTRARELAALGGRMNNCLPTYYDRCEEGSSRIFSVHHIEEDRLEAAVELVWTARGWEVGQIEGPMRVRIPWDVAEAAKELALLYREAQTNAR